MADKNYLGEKDKVLPFNKDANKTKGLDFKDVHEGLVMDKKFDVLRSNTVLKAKK